MMADQEETEEERKDTLLSHDSEAANGKAVLANDGLPRHLKILYTATVYASFMGFVSQQSNYYIFFTYFLLVSA